MLPAYIRLGLFLPALAASLHVSAAPRFWALTGVRFNDGPAGPVATTFATGYFSYDDAMQTISRWNVHVEDFPFVFVPAFTYVPGNSIATVPPGSGRAMPTLLLSAEINAPAVSTMPAFGVRQLQIAPLTALDGSTASVSVDSSLSGEAIPSIGATRVRSIVAGSLTLMPVPPAVVGARVDEFYNAALKHYFITADDAEKQALDSGRHPGWQRTGESFNAYAQGSSTGDSINPVCRFYSPPILGNDVEFGPGFDSHFFSADATECVMVFRRYGTAWFLEDDNTFQIALPDKASGACPIGTMPVYRLWNQRVDSNHRYTTSTTIKAQMMAAGYVPEGYGSDGVVMCAAQ